MVTQNIEQRTEYNPYELVIISGVSKGIGRAFANHYAAQKNTLIEGISRSCKPGRVQCNGPRRLSLHNLDLLDKKRANCFPNMLGSDLLSFKLKDLESITCIHAIGIDKFEPDGKPHIDLNGDGIDDEVYAGNVTAFMNLVQPLIRAVRETNTPTTIVQIGSLSDIYGVPYWQSFTKSKNIVRQYLKSIASPTIKGITLSVGSTLDEEGRKYGRVNADTTYWQTAEELVEKSWRSIGRMRGLDSTYAEFDFYKHNPNFKQDYFTNLPELFTTWQKDMGLEGKEVPHGIRI
ncbi:hypothetical protein KA107_03600 [Candidatus Pacearchaeota archaeon]|nr:hypothetical protein [Candidatus Pacearchaeota archaeon]